jgi:hypothetical protein
VRQKTYSLDESEVKPYFPLDRMCEAIFDCAYQLFGLKFKLREDIASYHPDVQTYEVVFPLTCWLLWDQQALRFSTLRAVWACEAKTRIVVDALWEHSDAEHCFRLSAETFLCEACSGPSQFFLPFADIMLCTSALRC